MRFADWLIVVLPLLSIIGAAIYSGKYTLRGNGKAKRFISDARYQMNVPQNFLSVNGRKHFLREYTRMFLKYKVCFCGIQGLSVGLFRQQLHSSAGSSARSDFPAGERDPDRNIGKIADDPSSACFLFGISESIETA